MSRAKRFTFIFGVVIAAAAAIILITAYFYILELPRLKLGPYNLKAATIVQKIHTDTDISNFDDELVLYALKGQTAIGQVVMQANKDIEKAEIQIEKLTNKNGSGEITQENIAIGLQGFIDIRYKSDPIAYNLGKYPDPVIFDPLAFSLKKEQNQPLVIKIVTPKTANSGIYQGKIEAYFDGICEKSIPLKLYVFDEKFPIERKLHTLAGMDRTSVQKYYNKVSDQDSLFSNLVLDGLSHGINIFGTELERPFGINEVDTKELDFSKSDDFIARWRSKGLNSIYIPGDDNFHIPTYGETKFLEYLQQIKKHYQAKGWLEDAYIFPISDPETKESYLRVKKLYTLIGKNVPEFSRLLTEQVTPDKKNWEDLSSVVDIWIAQGEKYYEDYEAMQDARKKGDEIGFYTPGRYAGFEGYSKLKSPSHSIDRAFNDLVFVGLEAYRNSDTYHLMWNTTYWLEANPWENPQTWETGRQADGTTRAGNGAGYLYYPGTEISKYMKSQEDRQAEFVPSLRLLALEQGLNLYEVATLADLQKNIVPEFSKISEISANREYKIFLNRLYKNFKINEKMPEFDDDYESRWNFDFKSFLPKW